MSLFYWTTRCCGGLACFLLICLSLLVLSREATTESHTQFTSVSSISLLDVCTIGFAYYGLFIHICLVLFSVRACWGIFDITFRIRKVAQPPPLQPSFQRRDSTTSLNSDDTLTSPHTPSACGSEIVDNGFGASCPSIIHAIVIPNYKEELDTLRETLEVLACQQNARNQYDVSLFAPATPLVQLKLIFLPISAPKFSGIFGNGTARTQCLFEVIGPHSGICQKIPELGVYHASQRHSRRSPWERE